MKLPRHVTWKHVEALRKVCQGCPHLTKSQHRDEMVLLSGDTGLVDHCMQADMHIEYRVASLVRDNGTWEFPGEICPWRNDAEDA